MRSHASSGEAASTTSNASRTKSGAGAGGSYQKSRGETRPRTARGRMTSGRRSAPPVGSFFVDGTFGVDERREARAEVRVDRPHPLVVALLPRHVAEAVLVAVPRPEAPLEALVAARLL